MGNIVGLTGEKLAPEFELEDIEGIQNELDQFLFELGYGLVSTFFNKGPTDLTEEDIDSVKAYAAKISSDNPALSVALNHVVTAWNNMQEVV